MVFSSFFFSCPLSFSLAHTHAFDGSENPSKCGHSLEMTLFKVKLLCKRAAHRNTSNRQKFSMAMFYTVREHKRNQIHQIKRHFVVRNCFRVLCYIRLLLLFLFFSSSSYYKRSAFKCGFFDGGSNSGIVVAVENVEPLDKRRRRRHDEPKLIYVHNLSEAVFCIKFRLFLLFSTD